jgi:hypothetical protein
MAQYTIHVMHFWMQNINKENKCYPSAEKHVNMW